MIPWAWTGFTGNSLWDWLNLAALPLAVALIPVFLERARRTGAAGTPSSLAAGAAVFLGLVLAGYLAKWRWTGFTGNTVWDWLHLLLLPLLVPVVIVPALRPMALARLGVTPEAPAAPFAPAPPERGAAPVPPEARPRPRRQPTRWPRPQSRRDASWLRLRQLRRHTSLAARRATSARRA